MQAFRLMAPTFGASTAMLQELAASCISLGLLRLDEELLHFAHQNQGTRYDHDLLARRNQLPTKSWQE